MYWYEYRLRGFSLGCQPKDFVDVNHEHGRFGAVAYNRELTDEEVERYELTKIEPKENKLKVLAKEMVWVNDELDKENLYEWDRDEFKKKADEIQMKVISGNYSIDLFIQYMNEYRNLSLGEYNEWIKS
ncbi:hypothetical protein [Bacillus gaemokensis]|nr:hypothetical protein [Bacillus gaemokensis]